MSSLGTTFRQRLREAMAARSVKVSALAHKSGYSEEHIRRVLNGTRPNPSLMFVECVSGALEISPLTLLGERQ